MPANLYVHFPFCRRKCSYCALYSRVGVSQSDRDAYVRRLAAEVDKIGQTRFDKLRTVYFGGGSPALCDLRPLLKALRPLLKNGDDNRQTTSDKRGMETEFTVELHPLDVTEDLLVTLRDGGVNRISMGVQSLNDATLVDMGRGYTLAEAERAFALVKRHFDNAGIDLIVGYPGDDVEVKGGGGRWNLQRLSHWGLTHCSVYSLQNERGLKNVPSDDWTLDRLRQIAAGLKEMGLERYEISNYAVPGCECRHNLAVWRGEDYIGLGEGAYGRVGLTRTVGRKTGVETSRVTPEEDLKERTLFRLRTREGVTLSQLRKWGQTPCQGGQTLGGKRGQTLEETLEKYVKEGLLEKNGEVYRLTERGTEVCDSILAELV